jgi:hypothetical protein
MFWMELRCDLRLASDCYSNVNNGPMGGFIKVLLGADTLRGQAKLEGWKTSVYTAVCPACVKASVK